MDPRIVELLARLGDVDDLQLGDLEDILVTQLEDAAETKDVDMARSLGEAIEKVRGERVQRAELAREREREIAEIMSRVHAQTEDGEGEDNGDSNDESDDDSSDDDKATDEAPARVEASVSDKNRPLPKIGDLLRKKQAAAASSGSLSGRPSRSSDRTAGTTTVVAASDVPGIPAGSELPDRQSIRKAMVERWNAVSGSRTSGKIPVVKWQMNYPEERILRAGDEEGNWEKIQRLLSPSALLASGGICAPPAGFYDTVTLATADRPLRNSLAVFGAERGGIRFIPSVSVADVGGAITVVTNAEDVAGATKSCLTIVCEDVDEVLVQAISRCLQFGNFNARTHPEYVSHLSDLTLAAHARTAEEELWQAMCAAASSVTADENLSAWRDFYASLARAAAAFRSRHRMSTESVLRVVAPAWLATMFSVDAIRQQPGDNTVVGLARTQFEQGLRTLNLSITWTHEGSTSTPQVFGTQNGGGSPLLGWPDTVQVLMYAEGTYLFLDGGALDLGIVRDSTLNSTNDFQTFAETFEAVAFLGPEALCLTIDVCPSGLSVGTSTTAIDCTGAAS